MTKPNLSELYRSLNKNVEKVFVVPKINYSLPDTDYLYRLYSNYIKSPNNILSIESLTVFAHPKIFFKSIFNRKTILHYHWFEVQDLKSFAGIFWKLFWIILYKLSGGKIIWTVHNIYPHTISFKSFNKFIRRIFAKLADRLHVHCDSAVNIMTDILNVDSKKFYVLEHPDFTAHLFQRIQAADKINSNYSLEFTNDDIIFLMFGNIASYKGILETAEMFTNLPDNKKLLIAGGVKKGNSEYFNKILNISLKSKNIKIIDKIIPENNVPVFFNLSDYVIFNYKQVLTSGGIVLALNYNKKVIAPAKGCIPEFGNSNIILFNKPDSSNDTLLNLLQSL